MATVERGALGGNPRDIWMDGPWYFPNFPMVPVVTLSLTNGDHRIFICCECGCDIHVSMSTTGCVEAGRQFASGAHESQQACIVCVQVAHMA